MVVLLKHWQPNGDVRTCRQCTGNPALNYSDAYLNSLPTAINLTTGDSLFTHEQVIAICPVLSTVEVCVACEKPSKT